MEKQRLLLVLCIVLLCTSLYQANKCSTLEDQILYRNASLDSLKVQYDVLNSDLNVEKMINMRYEYALDILNERDSIAAYKYKVILTEETE
jgi:hypothetical protein